jgi:hypothetical protein
VGWFKKKKPADEPAGKSAYDDADAEMTRLEESDELPRDPRDWPKGKASYLTYGNQGDEAYGDGATGKLGPAEVAHHEDGSVTVGGKRVDDPSAYKGTPITGGIMQQLDEQLARNRELREGEEKPDGG